MPESLFVNALKYVRPASSYLASVLQGYGLLKVKKT